MLNLLTEVTRQPPVWPKNCTLHNPFNTQMPNKYAALLKLHNIYQEANHRRLYVVHKETARLSQARPGPSDNQPPFTGHGNNIHQIVQ
jgi:hypothetical protein